jgi:DNA-binding CsgD family transcriptional regulator
LGSTPPRQPTRAQIASAAKSLAAEPVVRTLAVGALLLALPVTVYGWRRTRRRSRQHESQAEDLRSARSQLARQSDRVEALVKGLGDTIERQFAIWGLTAAEREVALLMLKGVKHKGIAEIRRTSERTARHQALAIYRKANLDGRTDLVAYFLEDMLTPVPADSRTN